MLIWRSQRITSSSAQYVMIPAKIFLTSKFSYLLFFATPLPCPYTWTWDCDQLGAANHLDQALWKATQKQGGSVRSYLLHSSLAGAQLCCTFCQPQQTVHILLGQNHFAQPNGHVLTLLHQILIFRESDILSTAGDALRSQTKSYPHERFCYFVKL